MRSEIGGHTLQGLHHHIESLVHGVQTQTKIPGIAVSVAVGGERLSINVGTLSVDSGYGLSADAGFHIGCITKFLLAIVVLELARDNILSLSEPIGSYLPELRDTPHGRAVTQRHLLSHTSGYRGTNIFDKDTQRLTWTRFAEYLHCAPQFFVPGTVFSYEHSEAAILGRLILAITGEHALGLIRRRIFQPLNITPSALGDVDGAAPSQVGQHYFDQRTGNYERLYWSDMRINEREIISDFWLPAFSDLTLSLNDLLTILEASMRRAEHGDAANAVLSANSLIPMARSIVRVPSMVGGAICELTPRGFGLGTAQWQGGFNGNGGSSYGQCSGIRFDVSRGIAVAVVMNVSAPFLRDFLLAGVCQILGGEPAKPRQTQQFEFNFGDLVGTYLGCGKGRVCVSVGGRGLVCTIGSEDSDQQLHAELAIDDDGSAQLYCAQPQLSIGFFKEPGRQNFGLMMGLCAYKRVDIS